MPRVPKKFLKSHPIGSILVGTVAVFFLIDFAYGVYLQNYEISGYTKYNKAYEEHSAIFSGPFSFYIAVLGRYTGAHIQDIGVALTAVATVVMAVFTGRLWFSTEKLWGEAKATSEIANRSAKAAEDTVLKMEDTAKKELRAYLGVIRGHIEMYSAIFGTSKTRYKVFVDIANSGQTPAKNVRRAVDAKLLTPDHRVFESTVENNNWVIAPNGPYWSLVKILDLTNEDVVAVNNKKMSIFIWGKAIYEDIFGREHELGFRYKTSDPRLPQGWYFEPEPEGNYSKDGE